MGTDIFLNKVVLIGGWCHIGIHLIRKSLFAVALVWDVNMLTITSVWRCHVGLLRMVLHASGEVSLLVLELHFLRILVKVLGRLIEHLSLFNNVLLIKILVEASPCWTSSWICRSLSVSFDALNDLSGFWIYSSEWVHLLRIVNWCISWVTVSFTLGHSCIHLLIGWGVLHIDILTVDWGSHVELLRSHYKLRVLALPDVCGVVNSSILRKHQLSSGVWAICYFFLLNYRLNTLWWNCRHDRSSRSINDCVTPILFPLLLNLSLLLLFAYNLF